MARQHLIVTRSIGLEIQSVADVELHDVVIRRAFRFPYAAGDFQFVEEDFDASPSYRESPAVESIVEHFATKFACDAPNERYAEIVTRRLNPQQAGMPLAIRMDRAIGILSDEVVRIDLERLDAWGLYRDSCFVCSDETFGVLAPHVQEPFFWKERVAREVIDED
jgi:hypothetical protein